MTISDLRQDLDHQTEELTSLFRSIEHGLLVRRPPTGKWSAVEHLGHIIKVNEKYADALEAAIEQGRARGKTGMGPFRGSMLGRAFARNMEPPVKLRVKTMKEMQPDSELPVEPTLTAFTELQHRLGDLLANAEGLDLDRIRTPSPFLRILRAPVFSWFCVVTAHTRRHVWLIRETLTQLGNAVDY